MTKQSEVNLGEMDDGSQEVLLASVCELRGPETDTHLVDIDNLLELAHKIQRGHAADAQDVTVGPWTSPDDGEGRLRLQVSGFEFFLQPKQVKGLSKVLREAMDPIADRRPDVPEARVKGWEAGRLCIKFGADVYALTRRQVEYLICELQVNIGHDPEDVSLYRDLLSQVGITAGLVGAFSLYDVPAAVVRLKERSSTRELERTQRLLAHHEEQSVKLVARVRRLKKIIKAIVGKL